MDVTWKPVPVCGFILLCLLGLFMITCLYPVWSPGPDEPVTIRGVVLEINKTQNSLVLQPFCNDTWCGQRITGPVNKTVPLADVFHAVYPKDHVEGTYRSGKWVTISRFASSPDPWSEITDVYGDPAYLHAPLYKNLTLSFQPSGNMTDPDITLSVNGSDSQTLQRNSAITSLLSPEISVLIHYAGYTKNPQPPNDLVMVIHAGPPIHASGNAFISGGGLNLTRALNAAQGSRAPASIPVVRGSPYRFSDTFPADPSVREVRLWLISDDSVFTVIAPVYGGTTMSEKTLRFIFNENQTALLPPGITSVILERPGEDNQYALSLNQTTGDITLHENGQEPVIFNRHEIPRNQSGADASATLSRAITRANPRFPARETTLQVEDPYISIETPGDHPAGYPFTIRGTTNLGEGDEIVVLVASTATTPCPKSGCHRLSLNQKIRVDGWYGTEKRWTMDDRTSEKLTPGEYYVEAAVPRTGTKDTRVFNITPPVITIDPVSSRTVHDPMSITGTTNLPAGETIFVEISDSAFFGQCHLRRECNVGSASGSAIVAAGMKKGLNTWNFSCNMSLLGESDEFLVRAHSFDTESYSDLFRITR